MRWWRTVRAGLAFSARLVALAWLVVHFILTLAYVMPVNPVKIVLQPFLYATIGTYFSQNWSLFAPNPVSSDLVFLARPLTDAEVAAIPTHGLPTTGWYDLSTPLWERFQKNRFTAYDRLARPQGSSVRRYLSGGSELAPWWEACRKGDADACDFFDTQLTFARAQAAKLFAKIASAFCNDVQSGASFVAVRVREKLSVPWSVRYTAQPQVREIDLGVYPVDKTVTGPRLYVAEGARS